MAYIEIHVRLGSLSRCKRDLRVPIIICLTKHYYPSVRRSLVNHWKYLNLVKFFQTENLNYTNRQYYGLRIVVVNNQLQPKYKRRDTVVHQEFGIGAVIKSEITYNDEEVTVAFPGIGIKKVPVAGGKLEKSQQPINLNKRQNQYKRRDSVKHTKFEVGTVIESEFTRRGEVITIAFPGIGIKKLDVSSDLQKI